VLRIRSRPPVGHLIQQVILTAVGVFDDRRVLFAHVPLAQVIEAQVRHDPINPGVEGTLEPETSNVLVSLQEGVLVDVLGILLSSGEMEGEPQYRLVVMTDKFLEGGAVSSPGLSEQHRVVYTAFFPTHLAQRFREKQNTCPQLHPAVWHRKCPDSYATFLQTLTVLQ